MTLYAYIADTGCTKCGSTDIVDRFHRKQRMEHSGNGLDCTWNTECGRQDLPMEHILRHCRRCSYEWPCAPLDAERVATEHTEEQR